MSNSTHEIQDVFSTYVEVILRRMRWEGRWTRFLHVCGGDPNSTMARTNQLLVFSTYVEVILKNRLKGVNQEGFLHVCGGDPVLSRIRIERI